MKLTTLFILVSRQRMHESIPYSLVCFNDKLLDLAQTQLHVYCDKYKWIMKVVGCYIAVGLYPTDVASTVVQCYYL